MADRQDALIVVNASRASAEPKQSATGVRKNAGKNTAFLTEAFIACIASMARAGWKHIEPPHGGADPGIEKPEDGGRQQQCREWQNARGDHVRVSC
jgi:hypothetical protein